MSSYNPQLVRQMGLQGAISAPAAPMDMGAGLSALQERFAANSNNEDALFPIENANPYEMGGHGATAPKPDQNLDRGPGAMMGMPMMGGGMGGMPMGAPQGAPMGGAPDRQMMAQMLADRMRQKAARSQQMQQMGPQASAQMKQGAY